MSERKSLQQEIMDLLIERATGEWEYINPYFLSQINDALDDFYDWDNEIVNDWINEMWGA